MSNVLVIDDSIFARNMIRKILVKKGYHVCGEAANGREGLEAFKNLNPDLVFCDIMMDEMDGLECLRAMLEVNPDANVVICTSAADELHVREAFEIGAKEFMPKPIIAAEVLRITKKLIGKPEAGGRTSYKSIIEGRASQAGVSGKPLLDFYEAFHKYTGYKFDDKEVDEKYLRKNGPGIKIGVRALLAAKLPDDQAENIVNVFESLYL